MPIMESIWAIAMGLSLRGVVSAVGNNDVRIAGSLVGLWEGVVLYHFLQKPSMRKSFDPYIGLGVRLFIDFLISESISKLTIVLMWTGLGVVLADTAPVIWTDYGFKQAWRDVRRQISSVRYFRWRSVRNIRAPVSTRVRFHSDPVPSRASSFVSNARSPLSVVSSAITASETGSTFSSIVPTSPTMSTLSVPPQTYGSVPLRSAKQAPGAFTDVSETDTERSVNNSPMIIQREFEPQIQSFVPPDLSVTDDTDRDTSVSSRSSVIYDPEITPVVDIPDAYEEPGWHVDETSAANLDLTPKQDSYPLPTPDDSVSDPDNESPPEVQPLLADTPIIPDQFTPDEDWEHVEGQPPQIDLIALETSRKNSPAPSIAITQAESVNTDTPWAFLRVIPPTPAGSVANDEVEFNPGPVTPTSLFSFPEPTMKDLPAMPSTDQQKRDDDQALADVVKALDLPPPFESVYPTPLTTNNEHLTPESASNGENKEDAKSNRSSVSSHHTRMVITDALEQRKKANMLQKQIIDLEQEIQLPKCSNSAKKKKKKEITNLITELKELRENAFKELFSAHNSKTPPGEVNLQDLEADEAVLVVMEALESLLGNEAEVDASKDATTIDTTRVVNLRVLLGKDLKALSVKPKILESMKAFDINVAEDPANSRVLVITLPENSE